MERRSQKSRTAGKNTFELDSASALSEFVNHRPESVLSVEVAEGQREYWVDLFEKNGLDPASVKSSSRLSDSVRAEVRIKELSFAECSKQIETMFPTPLIALDHIEDPRNLGAIIRSAAFFGVPYILIPGRRQVHLTQAVVATSMGGLASCHLVDVGNLGNTLQKLKAWGYRIVGADMHGSALNEVASESKASVVVLGSETKGLSQRVSELCDVLVAIASPSAGVESLNVSVAAGILMHAFVEK